MGAYTSCTIYCDHPNRRPNHTDGPYNFICKNENSSEAVHHCMTKMASLCSGGTGNVKSDQIKLHNELLNCPERGMAEHTFVGIIYGVFLLTIMCMGVCQYTVGLAYVKERKIYRKLAYLTGIGAWKSTQAPCELLPRKDEEYDDVNVDKEDDDANNILAEPVGPITTPSVQQVQIAALGGGNTRLQLIDFNNAAFDHLSAIDRSLTDGTNSETSFRTQQRRRLNEFSNGPLPELKPLQRAAWLACWCQMAVLFAWFLVVCMMLYVFLYYKPKVEQDAKVPSETTGKHPPFGLYYRK